MQTMKMLTVLLSLLLWGYQGWAQENNWVGTWQYEAPQAGEPYQKGKIVFTMEGETLQAYVEVNQSKIQVQQLEVSQDQATFSITLDGQPIQVKLQKEGEALTGAATYSNGEVSFTAEKGV